MTDAELTPFDRAYDDAYGPGYSAKVEKKPELTRIRRGCWRNLWRDPRGRCLVDPALEGARAEGRVPDAFHCWGKLRYVSREQAEQKAIEADRKHRERNWSWQWIDAKFFSEA